VGKLPPSTTSASLLRFGRKTESARVLQPVASPESGSRRSRWGSCHPQQHRQVYSDLGEKQKALEYYSQSLPLRRAVGDRRGEAITLTNIGRVYSELGEKQKALDYYSQSLPLSRAVGDRSGEAYTLTNIGRVYSELGEKQKALDYYSQSLPLTRAVGDRGGEATPSTTSAESTQNWEKNRKL
jgi:tetratricopeptide (TPR) repeat protein